MKASCSSLESNFNLLSYNLNTLYPLLESNIPLKDQLVPDPNSPYIVRRDQFFYSNKYLITWRWRGTFGEPFPQESLLANISITMNLLFETIKQTRTIRQNYHRHLKDYINNRHFDTRYLADNRAALKIFFENIYPFIKKLRKTNSEVTSELFRAEQPQQQAESSYETESAVKVPSKDPRLYFNKDIMTLIELETIYGGLLPYSRLIKDAYSYPLSNIELIQHIAANVFSKTDFKKSYRALRYLHTLFDVKIPNMKHYYLILFKLNIPLIRFPDSKVDRARRSLTKGSSVTLIPGKTIVLDERISPLKSGPDGRIIFRMDDNPHQVIIFYTNQHYYSFLQERIRNDETVLVPTVPTIYVDEKCLWSIEEYIPPGPLPFNNFLKLVHHILVRGPRNAIDFSTITLDSRQKPVALKPIYQMKNDYIALVESLISYYNAGNYTQECPTLHLFLTLCLEKSLPSDRKFFLDLTNAALHLNLHPEEGEKLQVINDSVANYLILSENEGFECRSASNLRQHCQELVNRILEQRIRYLGASQDPKMLVNFNNQIINQVQAWILPP